MADNNNGRPPIPDEQFEKWLEDMKPFLKQGQTLNHAMESADIIKHEWSVRAKYKLGDWFSRKVDTYRSYPAKMTNDIFAGILESAHERVKQGKTVEEDVMKNVRFYAEKSRSTQAYFVNRTETAEGKTVDEVLDEIDEKETIDDVADNISKDITQPPTEAPIPDITGMTINADGQQDPNVTG